MPWAQEAGKRDEKVGSKPKDWPQGKQADEISSFEYWINTHTLEIPQTKNRRVPLPWHKGAVNGIKSDLDNSFITYSATKKKYRLEIDFGKQWLLGQLQSPPHSLLCDTGVDLQTVSFASGHSIRWHWRDTAGGKGPWSPGSRAIPSCCYSSHCQHVPVWPAPCKSQWCTFSSYAGPRGSFPKCTGTPIHDFLPVPWLWHLSTLQPAGHTSPSMRPNLSLVGRERAHPSLSLPWVLSLSWQVMATPCSC